MIDLVERLADTGHAYEAEGDVYFCVRNHADYGELSHRDVDEQQGFGKVALPRLSRDGSKGVPHANGVQVLNNLRRHTF